MKIRTPRKKVMFNMSERELCGECGFPEGFCKHTIQDEYKEACPNTPLTKEDIWQLVRSYAIVKTQSNNLFSYVQKEFGKINKLHNETGLRIKELKEFVSKVEESNNHNLK